LAGWGSTNTAWRVRKRQMDPIAWSIVAIANKHAAKGLGGYFLPKLIF
jgi:hypothetical protein